MTKILDKTIKGLQYAIIGVCTTTIIACVVLILMVL